MQGHHILIPDLISDVPSVVGVVGADAIGTVNLGNPVDGIINIGSGKTLPVSHFNKVVIQVVFIAYLYAVRIEDGT